MIDVAIIGCGIVGSAVAYELSKYQLSVAVFEKENDVAMGTTKANSAIVHAGYDPKPGTLMAELNVEGVKLTKKLCAQLDVPYKQCGSLVVTFSHDQLKNLKILYDKGIENGVPDMQILTGEEARILEPNLSPEICGALFAPSAAIISPWEFALALAETAVKNNAKLYLEHAVENIEKTANSYIIHTSKGDFESKCIINAAGVHADTIHNMVATPDFKIIPDRGEYYLLDKSEGERVSHVIFQCPTNIGKGTLIAPTVHGNLIVGPNNEKPSNPDDTATTSLGLESIAKLAYKSVPSVNLRESIRNFAGIRAVADCDDFIIKESVHGFFDVAGIKSPGLSAAPAIAKMVLGMVNNFFLTLNPKPEVVTTRKKIRFKELSIQEKNELIKKDPDYGRIICRCENITEGEISACINAPIPPRSVDGVKRRCNAGMGRCQGGFCGARVVELLSGKYGVPMTDILLDKSGTYILTKETKCK